MTTPANSIPLSIDYTSRDFYALREELMTLVKQRVNSNGAKQWTGDDPTDFGVALVEAFAYIGDLLNYYIDRAANESYLPTATQRKSVLNLARQFGYNPTGYRAAMLQVRFTNSGSVDITVPAGTQLSGAVIEDESITDVIFYTSQDVLVSAGSTATVYASHGEAVNLRPLNLSSGGGDIAGELLGTSDGSANQSFVLSENQVVEGTIELYVAAGGVYQPWKEVTHLSDYGPSDAVYTTSIDDNNFVYVIFGDGISGAIPGNLAGIKANYIVGGGTVGNISTGILDTIYRVPGYSPSQFNSLTSVMDVTNIEVGSGGSDPEDNDSIRTNASLAVKAINRAVSLEDYKSLALYATNVGKANATAAIWTSVTLYIAPLRNPEDPDKFPGMDAGNAIPTSEWNAIKTNVETFFQGKTQIGATLTISPPSYVLANIQITYSKNDQYSSADAETDLKTTLLNAYAYAYQDFAQVITPEQIEMQLNGLASVKNARVSLLYRNGGTSTRAPLIGKAAEIFVFTEDNISLSEWSNDARLTGMGTLPNGTTLTPTFNRDFYSYSLNGVSTGTITLSPTAPTGATILVNGAPATTPVATPSSNVTNIPITVIAADGTTVKTYTVTVSR